MAQRIDRTPDERFPSERRRTVAGSNALSFLLDLPGHVGVLNLLDYALVARLQDLDPDVRTIVVHAERSTRQRDFFIWRI